MVTFMLGAAMTQTVRIAWFATVLFWVPYSEAWGGPQEDLWRAAESGRTITANKALKDGARIDGRDKDGWTALLYASAGGHLSMANLLLALGASPNVASNDGQTPLMGAVVAGNLELVQALVAAGANAKAKLPNGKTAVDLATANRRLDLAAVMDRSSAGKAPPVTAKAPPDAREPAQQQPGVKTELIRAFLAESGEREQRSQVLGQKQGQVAQQTEREAAEKRAKEAARDQAYATCLESVSTCKANCRSQFHTSMATNLISGVLSGSRNSEQQKAMMDSAPQGDACEANCESSNRCIR